MSPANGRVERQSSALERRLNDETSTMPTQIPCCTRTNIWRSCVTKDNQRVNAGLDDPSGTSHLKKLYYTITRNTFCRTPSLSNATFSFLIMWRSSSSKSVAVYKISAKSDDLSLRYGDITIFKMAAVRHLGIVLPPYEHTRPPTKFLLLAAAAWQISCQSDTQIWRCSYLNFSHIWLEMPIQAPKWGFWGTLNP